MRRYRQRVKQNPQLHAVYKQRQIAYQKKYLTKMRISDPYAIYEHHDVNERQQNISEPGCLAHQSWWGNLPTSHQEVKRVYRGETGLGNKT